MENKLQVFNFKEQQVDVIIIDGEPHFIGKQVCDILGYVNPRKAIGDHVDAEDKQMVNLNTVTNRDGTSGNPNITIINESGLYSLILSSKLESAKEFKRWVTSEVLPSIRKTGRYELPQLAPHPRYRARLIGTAIKDIGVTSRMLQEVFHVREGLALSKATVLIEQTYEIDLSPVKELLPAAEHDVGSLTPTQLAKMIGDMSNRAVNKALVALGFQIKTENGYELTDAGREYGEMVPFTSKNSKHTGYQPKWNTKVIAEIKNVTA